MTRPAGVLRIATRSSRLALWQARHVAGLLESVGAVERVELVEVSTAGDRDRVRPLSGLGEIGVFTREIQAAVLDRRADLAVHSLKDLPTEAVDGLVLAAVPARSSTADALVLPASFDPVEMLADLPGRAVVGTGSIRRKAQLLAQRSDLQIADVRGNVETRLRKLDDGEYGALVLAVAGLERLDLVDRVSLRLEPPVMYPAVGQGALGVECLAADDAVRELVTAIDEPLTRAAVTAERGLLAGLRAGCHAPVGVASGNGDGGSLKLDAVVLSSDGRERIEASAEADWGSAAGLGEQLARTLLDRGADRLIAAGGS